MSSDAKLQKARGFDVWLEVGRTHIKVHRVLNQMLDTVDLSLAQHEILINIYYNTGLTQKQLSEQLLVVKSNVTALLKKLESRGLVQRKIDSHDSRNKRLSLTKAGEQLLQRSFALQNTVVEAMMSVMSDAELDQLDALMGRVNDALESLR